MKRFIALPFALLYSLILLAQTTIGTKKVGWKASHLELNTISDKDKKQNCIFLENTDSIKGLLLDNRGGIAHEWTIPRIGKERLLGGFIKEGKVYLYLYNNTDELFHTYVFEGDTQRESVIPFAIKKEKEVDRISCGDHFMYFTVNKKSSELIIYDFHDETKLDTLHYHFEDDLWTKLSKSNSNFGRDVNVAKVDLEGECSVDIAQTPNKLYYMHDSLFLVMNHERGVTTILTFDMLHKQVTPRQIDHGDPVMEQPGVTAYYSDNSFLLGNKLYYVLATFDSLCIQVHDFADGRLLKKFCTGRNEEVSFKNTPITQEGGDMSAKATKELGKTKQLLRKMVNGRAVIVATRDGAGRITLAIGSYTKVTGGGGGGFAPFPGGGGGGAPIFIPTGGFSRGASWTKSARFRMLLDENTLAHLDGEADPSVNEKIEKYTEGMSIPENAEILFLQDGMYVYVYYDKNERMLVFTRF